MNHMHNIQEPSVSGNKPVKAGIQGRLDAIDEKWRLIVDSTQIEHVPVTELHPDPKNARKHPEHQIERLTGIIREVGFVGAIIIDEHGKVIAGHGRLEAGKRIGMHTIPCIRVNHLDEQQKQALALADNRLAELSAWDDIILAASLQELSISAPDFDIEIIGFDTPDLDRLLGPEPDPRHGRKNSDAFSQDPDDDIPEVKAGRPSISQPGDLWYLGKHRLMQDNALDGDCYHVLMGGELATQIVTDPPYNVANRGHVSSQSFREFAMAHGEMSPAAFTEFLASCLGHAANVAIDGAILHVCMDWRHTGELTAASSQAGLEVKNVCVWTKPSPGQGSFYRSQHEFVYVLKSGTAPHINNFGLGGRGRLRTNVWPYPAVRGNRRGVNDPDGGHPTVKPVSMIMDAIRDCSRRGDIVLDPFGGSGTALIAAERTGRKGYLMEIDGHYVDLTIRRWQAITGGTAIRFSDNASFNDLDTESARDATNGEKA